MGRNSYEFKITSLCQLPTYIQQQTYTHVCTCVHKIFVHVGCLYHSLTCFEYPYIQEEQPRLSEHMVRFTRYFRADSGQTELVLSVVKIPYACAASWGVKVESRFNHWPAGLVFTFDGHRTLVFWQGGSEQCFRLRGQRVAADLEKQTYRPRKAPHRGWTFNEVTKNCCDKNIHSNWHALSGFTKL